MNDDLVSIRVIGLPVALAAEAREHFDELSREFSLLREHDQSLEHDVPGRLLNLSDELRDRFAAFTTSNDEELLQAEQRGEETVDLEYLVPAAAAEAARELDVMLDEADAFCQAGDYLLTLKASPAVVAYRRWYLEQFRTQAEGAPPIPFAEWSPEDGGPG